MRNIKTLAEVREISLDKVERARRSRQVNLKSILGLIDINGPDGAGKSTLSSYLAKQLSIQHPYQVISLSNLNGSAGLREIKRRIALSSDSSEISQLYLDGTITYYKEIIPHLLQTGIGAIVDGSVDKLLVYQLVQHNYQRYFELLDMVMRGTLTSNTWAAHRIQIFSEGDSIEDRSANIWKNLEDRRNIEGGLSRFDPQSYNEVVSRVTSSDIVNETMLGLDVIGSSTQNITLRRVSEPQRTFYYGRLTAEFVQ
jgi:adenylate kinase family enzyme